MDLSIVIPVYNEEAGLPELCTRLRSTFGQAEGIESYEIIFVNDGSRDASLDVLRREKENDEHIRIVNLSRNFGHQPAITAGLDYAKGEAIAFMDADLQDPPEVLLEMMVKIREGYDVVYGKRKVREGENWFKLATAAMFYRILNQLTKISIPIDTGDFRIMTRRVAEDLKKCKEMNRFIRGLVSWVGYKQIAVEYVRHERYAGETKFPLPVMMKYAWDGITSFSVVPLKLASLLGFVSLVLAVGLVFFVLYAKLSGQFEIIPGWSSIMIAILFFSGVQLLILGIIGEYIGRISDEVKNRPLYLVESFD